ncbi:winged helix-turn-helix domain-containing protein [Rhizobium ruizarguesonis]|uniref:winged helix-turn-helix domain-containing protein n=1 Tax=Rhizobium ruizarguesonis TaxID=2081791 RepID=UPI0016978815|nr:winged helix-turn-helix domain-containing protein [Rhizobium ruizarguesonis]MBC2804118.1 winged helix-turn-helix domain-containing protein [Rhizobium ruizarguesonis]
MAVSPEENRFSFGAFVLDLQTGLLARDGFVVPIRPKTFTLLMHLLHNPNRVISKDELIAAVWERAVVTDDALTQTVRDLRRILGDEGARLQSLPKRGYVFAHEPAKDNGAKPGLDGRHPPSVDLSPPGSASHAASIHAALLPPADLSRIIGVIYDCTLDPTRWETALSEIAAVMDAESAILSLNDLSRHRVIIHKNVGWGEEGIAERQKHMPEIHARLGEWFATGAPLDEPYVASRRLPPSYLDSSPYVQTCLKPRGIVDILHQFLIYTPTHLSELVISRHLRHGPITHREIGISALLLPHLRRAVTITNVLDARSVERLRLAQTLDLLHYGVVLTNSDGRILHTNARAKRMLDEGRFVTGRSGLLAAATTRASQELARAIRIAARDEAALDGAGLSVRLAGESGGELAAHVLPLNGSDLRISLEPAAVAAVFIGAPPPLDPVHSKGTLEKFLRERFGLSKAETDIALEVASGDDRAMVADRLGVSAAALRNDLGRIFLKTGVRHLSGLVRLLADAGHNQHGP